ncbi:MAG: hypothetical protein PHD82_12250 [Candidatus Riflebacteria bacterium]|jgi:hypothetical protein|nr:hypothetical protein [Candidatus Riflebacteria bacterium]
MRRTFLVILLILSFCQGFWHEERELLLCRAGHNEPGLNELAHAGETLDNPRPAQCFARIFASSRQFPHLILSRRQEIMQWPTMARFPSAPGQNRRFVDAIHPDEWGLTVLHLPRSDG